MEKLKEINIRKAQIKEAREIFEVIDYYARDNLLLARSLNEICEQIRDFWVAKAENKVIGCCALHPYSEELAEIRSLALLPGFQRKGIGKSLLVCALKEAEELGIKRVFTLTYKPEFFKKNNFRPVKKEELPQKIWRDCCKCRKFPLCTEEALIVILKDKGGKS